MWLEIPILNISYLGGPAHSTIFCDGRSNGSLGALSYQSGSCFMVQRKRIIKSTSFRVRVSFREAKWLESPCSCETLLFAERAGSPKYVHGM